MGKNLDSANIIRLLFLCLRKKMVKYSMGKFIITALQGKGTLVSMNRRVHE
jgi:hypothetical protein